MIFSLHSALLRLVVAFPLPGMLGALGVSVRQTPPYGHDSMYQSRPEGGTALRAVLNCFAVCSVSRV